MIPLGDASRSPLRFPIVTTLLIAANTLVFLMELAGGATFINRWSLVPADIMAGRNWITILTAMFMHAGWTHILGNMLFFWAFGPEIEDVMSPLRYLIFYLLGGLVATIAQILIDPTSTVPNLGASGAIAGVMGAVNDEREQTLNQLLVEMDGFDEHHEVIVLAATNRPDVLDPALLRPGRFDRQVVVAPPDRRGRLGILKIHTRGLRLAGDVKLDVLAGVTAGMSGADLANLCNEAALLAARLGHITIQMTDFETALDKIVLGEARPLVMNEKDRHVIAYHEAGHAITAWFTCEADPVHKVTIIPHGMALGITEQVPGEDKYNYSRSYLLARLAVMMGGRAAEELAIGEITTGAENDLKEATRLARKMVTRWAMTDFGLMTMNIDEEQPFLGYEISQGRGYSETSAAKVDEQVQQLLKERYDYTRRCLIERKAALDMLVSALMEHETVTQEQMERMVGSRPC